MTQRDATHAAALSPPHGGRAAALTGAGLQWGFVVLAAAVLAAFPFLPHGRQRQVEELSRVFLGILLEAMPFMLLGSLVGGAIEVFVSPEAVASVLAGRRKRTVLVAAAMGLVFPVCECAIVPVVRRLVRKGAPLSAAVAFLLGGPIVNPIVAASTAVAYNGEWSVVAARLGLGYLVAVLVGLAVGKVFADQQALLPQRGAGGREEPHVRAEGAVGKLTAACRHAAEDFLDVGRFLVVGAFVAAVLRSTVPAETLFPSAAGGVGSWLVMMALAFVLNLCSEADAFVAASFRGLAPLPAQLAFMVLGPMLDLKLLAMYLALFRKRAILALAATTAVGVFLAIFLYTQVAGLVQLCVLLARN